jgi:hypothetical protein
MIAITVVASLAVATGAGVLARQAATLPIGGQPDGLRAENNVSVENESSNTARFTATDLEESKKQEDQSIDRTELLRLDVELLTAEVNAFRQKIVAINFEMFQVHFRGKSDANESQIEGLQKSLQDLRKEYISKNRELRQKQSELKRLDAIEIERNRKKARRVAQLRANKGTGIDKRGARDKKPAPIEPAASDAPGISPVLDKRLSGIEGKLNNVLRALEGLKRGMRQ